MEKLIFSEEKLLLIKTYQKKKASRVPGYCQEKNNFLTCSDCRQPDWIIPISQSFYKGNEPEEMFWTDLSTKEF